jgi:hypothetical protein
MSLAGELNLGGEDNNHSSQPPKLNPIASRVALLHHERPEPLSIHSDLLAGILMQLLPWFWVKFFFSSMPCCWTQMN